MIGQLCLGESHSRINPHMRAEFVRRSCRKEGGGMFMKHLQVCQVQYCQQGVNLYYVGYNTTNNLSTFGGGSLTQLIVNVYQIIVL